MDTTSSGLALFAADRAEQFPHPDPQPLPRLRVTAFQASLAR